MFENLHAAMRRLALDAHPRAACGGVFGQGDDPVLLPVKEIASNSRAEFHLERDVLRRMEEEAGGPLLAIVYSHPSERETNVEPVLFTPSAAEMRWQISTSVPFIVVVTSPVEIMDLFWFGDQCPIPPILGRIFRHGVTDCYSLLRDWYRLERGIVVPDFPRDWDWWSAGEEGPDLYEKGFRSAGFRDIDRKDMAEGDVVLFRIRSRITNHAGVLLANGRMVHHAGYLSPIDATRLSHIVRIDRWARHATHWLRFGGLAD